MPDPLPPQFHIDRPTAWRPESAHLEIVGWLYAGDVTRCVDLRARVDKRATLGLYGLERPDTQRIFGGSEAALRTGFIQRVQVWRGAKEIALDWHDGTQWREFFRTALDSWALPANAAKPPRILRAGLVHQTLHHLYRHFHRASWGELCRETDAVLRDVLTANSDVPVADRLLGCIENPGYWINVGYEKFRVTGWAFGVGHDLARLGATTGVLSENRLVYPKDRPDVASHRPDHANSLKSGFYGLVDIRKDTPSPANLLIFAEAPDGTRSLAFARRLHLDRRDEHSGPVPVFKPFLFYRVVAAFLRGRLLGRYEFDSWPETRAEIARLRTHLASVLSHGEEAKIPAAIVRRKDQDPYTRWCWHNRLTPRLHTVLQQDAATAVQAGGPLISVVVPAYNTPEKYLRELLDCLKDQLYPRWELCIADDASPQPHVRRLLEAAARTDARIKPVFRPENGHISRATNSALDVATGTFVALLDHDDLLPADALLHVAEAILRHPTAGYLYTDEDKIDDTGRRFDPQFKGGWSPEMAITHNYTHHLTVIRRDIVEKAGRLRPEFNGAQDIDLFLRCWDLIDAQDVVHVPFVGYHWRAHAESTASRGDQKGYLFAAARNGIAEAVTRRGLRAEPVLPEFAKHYALCLHQLKWDAALLRENPVTIVIPTRNRADLLRTCLDSLARTTPRESVKVVIVDDNSDDPATLAYLQELPARADLRVEVLRAPATADRAPDAGITIPKTAASAALAAAGQAGTPATTGFNYSRLVNLGTARADTPLVLHLNNDVEALTPGWLEDMVGWLTVPGVGIVGAKLLYPDGTINHAGISLGREDGLPHVLFEREPAEDLGYLFLPHAARNVSAVTGACLLTRTDLYRQLGGFDEPKLQVAYNDVDFCLRAGTAGFRTVVSPSAVLRHVGSASRGTVYAEREHLEYLARHGTRRDPYHSEALHFPPRNLPLNPYHRRHAETARPFRAIALTQNLNFEGAPIFLFELARYLAAQPGVQLTIASAQDGPLRARFEAAGFKVEIWDATPLTGAKTPEQFAAALKTFAGTRAWDDADLFLCNTLLTFWGVHLAAHLGKTSAFYLHESKPVKRFFESILPPLMHPVAEEALRLATRVVFTATSTRDLHEEFNVNDNFRLLASWVDFDRIDAFAAAHEPAALRRKHGLDPDAVVVVNIGSICERKGQHIYIRGIDLLRKELPALYPGKKIQWVMVGARPGLYMETLQEDIALMGLQDTVKVFPETPDIYDFYRLADLLVCTSFEESFPRVILEAMTFGNRIVSTDVNGIAEMLTNTDEAYLVPAGDQHKLAAALKLALADHLAGDRKMISLARARAARAYHHSRALPRHLQVIREAWLG
ncbi:Hyaluronan synthase [Lacunisphaera limnophila]|uniref:Hyaluronan synthase n=1 Tax=Lacunisphaera limnophila TaxID=1838286 RepID=A0A1D8AVN9_9BACT|nr:glycosyltransferase [Lacunisphaera limnophila]AOS44968.1 Hyaluronan synthase [Lacunisphaera limnophila]